MKRLLFCAALFAGLWAPALWAHSVYVFAYPENGQICTNSYFNGKAKVRGGEISMLTISGKLLGRATTNEAGDACFATPEAAQDLLFRVTASGGHQGDFTLPAAEVWPNASSAPSSAKPRQAAEAESEQESRVRLRDIFGGLGWLVGLAGATAWYKSRRRSK